MSAISISWLRQKPLPTLMRSFTTIRDLGGPTFGLIAPLMKAWWLALAFIQRVR
jgi:hypothetical protein